LTATLAFIVLVFGAIFLAVEASLELFLVAVVFLETVFFGLTFFFSTLTLALESGTFFSTFFSAFFSIFFSTFFSFLISGFFSFFSIGFFANFTNLFLFYFIRIKNLN